MFHVLLHNLYDLPQCPPVYVHRFTPVDNCYGFIVSMPVAAVRPATLTLVSFSLLLSYARGRYALTGRFLYHVTPEVSMSCDPARLLVRFPFPSHMTLTVLVCVMRTRLDLSFVMLTFSCLCFSLIFGYVNSSFSRTSLRPCVYWTTRLLPVPVLLVPSLLPNDFTYPTGRYFCLVLFQLLRLFVLVSY